MKKEFTANTVDEAKDLAAAEFGADKSKITFTVIEEEKKGFLGFGKTDAKIIAEYEPSKAETAAEYIKSILSCMDIEAELDITENEDGAVIDNETGEEVKLSKSQAKEYERKIIAEARRRRAEMYGDGTVSDKDDD